MPHRPRPAPRPGRQVAALLLLLLATTTACQQQGEPPPAVPPGRTAPSASTGGADSSAATTDADPTDPATEEVLAVVRARNQAMIDRDVDALDRLLADDFTATHITGYEQSKQEWLEQIASGQMRYHGSVRSTPTSRSTARTPS